MAVSTKGAEKASLEKSKNEETKAKTNRRLAQLSLAKAFDVEVNELPLSLIISWYEQKAVCVLLALLHLGIKGIRLGPSLPAFLTPNVLDTLVKNFDIKPISSADEDLKAILG